MGLSLAGSSVDTAINPSLILNNVRVCSARRLFWKIRGRRAEQRPGSRSDRHTCTDILMRPSSKPCSSISQAEFVITVLYNKLECATEYLSA
jgi:hypothetical protein